MSWTYTKVFKTCTRASKVADKAFDAADEAFKAVNDAFKELEQDDTENGSLQTPHMNVKVEGKTVVINGDVTGVRLNGKDLVI